MGEVRRKVKMIQVDMLCDNCRDGYMRPIKDAETTNGFIHVCEGCATEVILPVRYPYVEIIKK